MRYGNRDGVRSVVVGMTRWLLAVLLCAAVIAGCSSENSTRTVRGTVRVQGGPGPNPVDKIWTFPVQITVTPSGGGKPFTVTSPNGSFELHLHDGTYEVQGGPIDISPTCSPVVSVTVSSTSMEPIELNCAMA
jgi:hypothetical protein